MIDLDKLLEKANRIRRGDYKHHSAGARDREHDTQEIVAAFILIAERMKRNASE